MKVKHYELSIDLLTKESSLNVTADITFVLPVCESELTFILNPSLRVKNVSTLNMPLRFNENIMQIKGTRATANVVTVDMLPNNCNSLSISYSGVLDGFTKMFPYVKDSISDNFTFFGGNRSVIPCFQVQKLIKY